MRLDKYLSHSGFGSRKEVKALLKKQMVLVNNEIVKDGKFNVQEEQDQVTVNGEPVCYQQFFYYLLNKPQGVITATKDAKEKTVMDLLKASDYRPDLFPVGRLDKDTVGLLLLTNDGDLAHQLLSPKKHVAKTYEAEIQGIVTLEDQQQFASGVTLTNGETCQAAELQILACDEKTAHSHIRLTIYEGKFHQVKRMFQAVGHKVLFLKRCTMGPLTLDPDLPLGTYRPLSSEELNSLKEITMR